MYRPVLVTAPTTPPVSLTEVKTHCRVDGSDEDALLTGLIAAATAHLDGWSGTLGRCLVTQTWRQHYDAFCREMRLPLYPVASIASVTYDDADDAEQTIASSNYQLLSDERGGFIRFNDGYGFPAINEKRPAIRIAYIAGEDAPPQALKQAILLLAGHWYANRETVVTGTVPTLLPMAVEALTAPFKRHWL